MPYRPSPPNLLEIFVLPIAGALVIEGVRTRHNELYLFTIALFLMLFRMAWASWLMPAVPDRPEWDRLRRRIKGWLSTEQVAAVFLLFFECADVLILGIRSREPIPPALYGILVLLYGVYVSFRIAARSTWVRAWDAAPESMTTADATAHG